MDYRSMMHEIRQVLYWIEQGSYSVLYCLPQIESIIRKYEEKDRKGNEVGIG